MDVPCTVEADGRHAGTIAVSLACIPELAACQSTQNLPLSLTMAGMTYEVTGEWLEHWSSDWRPRLLLGPDWCVAGRACIRTTHRAGIVERPSLRRE